MEPKVGVIGGKPLRSRFSMMAKYGGLSLEPSTTSQMEKEMTEKGCAFVSTAGIRPVPTQLTSQ